MADLFDGGFVEVYSTDTGLKQMVPAHFLDSPVLSAGLSVTPSTKAGGDVAPDEASGNTYAGPGPAGYPAGDPVEAWKADELKAYAAANDVDLAGTTTKAEYVTAITDHLAAGEGNAVDQTDPANNADNPEGA